MKRFLWIEQPKATETENVNPFEQPVSSGSVELTPQTDFWNRTEQSEANKTVKVTGKDQTKTLNQTLNLGQQNLDLGSIVTSETESGKLPAMVRGKDFETKEVTLTDVDNISASISLNAKASDSVTFSSTDTWFKNELISSGEDDFMRSRNTEFKGYGFEFFTKVYAFLDSQEVIVVPKLIEISTSRGGETSGSDGSFKKGETVLVEGSCMIQ